MQKGSAQLLIIFVSFVIAIFGVIYFYQNPRGKSLLQNPKLTVKQSELNDYSNTELGFGFKYSKDLNAKVDSEADFNKRGNGDFRKNFKGYVGYEPGKSLGAVAVLDERSSPSDKSSSFDNNPFSVWVFDNPDDLTVNSWFDKYWYYPYLWGVFDYSSKSHITLDTEATISGQMAKYKIVSYQPGSPKFIYISNNKKMYLFRVISEAGDKVLSTFEFLK